MYLASKEIDKSAHLLEQNLCRAHWVRGVHNDGIVKVVGGSLHKLNAIRDVDLQLAKPTVGLDLLLPRVGSS